MSAQAMDIALTPRAAEEIRAVMTYQELDPSTTAVRVDVAPGGGHLLDLVSDWSGGDDEVGESQGLRVVCRRESVARMSGTTIDFRDEVAGRGFVFDRPAEARDLTPRDPAEVQDQPRPDEAAVREALRRVIDPEVGLNIVDLGLVYGIRIQGRQVHLTMTMTTPACPLSEHIKQDATRSVLAVCPGVVDVAIDLVWDPPWESHMMSPQAKRQMGWAGA